MINIIIDGNYIFHKTYGIFGGYGDSDPSKVLAEKSDQGSFIRKISTDLCYSLRKLPQGGRVIFTSDSRSWRKDVEIEENEGYKRKEKREGDWSIFYHLLSSFGMHLEKMGFIFSSSTGAEGDDLIWYWSNHFNSNGENCIIISGDQDLHQLCSINPDTEAWTCFWTSNSKNNKFISPIGWETKYRKVKKEVSIFDADSFLSPSSDKLTDLISDSSLEEVDVRRFVFTKILNGDKGDNVPRVLSKITPKKSDQIYDLFMDTEWKSDPFDLIINKKDFMDWLSGICLRIAKEVDSSDNRDLIKSRIIRNFKLMWLSDFSVPPTVREEMDIEIERGLDLGKRPVTLDRVKLIENTEWAGQEVPSTYDPFKKFS